MDRNNSIQKTNKAPRPPLNSRHTSRLPLLMNILSESYNYNTPTEQFPDSDIASPDASITLSTDTSTPTHENNDSTSPVSPKEDTQASNKSNSMSTSPEKETLTDIRVSCVFLQGNKLAEKVRAVIDEAKRHRFEAEYYGKSKDPSVTRMAKSSEPVQLPSFANEFSAKNMDLRPSRIETNTNSGEHFKPGFEHPGNDETNCAPVPAVDEGCEANFRRIENSFVPIYTRSPSIHERTEGVETSWDGEKEVFFGPADDIPYFLTQAREPCAEQITRHNFRDLSGDASGTESSSSCCSAWDSQGSDDTTLTCPDDEWSPLDGAGDMETPQPGESAAPVAPTDPIEALLASLGVTGSPKPVDDRPLPPYQPLPEYSSLPSDGQRTPRSFADIVPTLSESSEEEIRGRTLSWSSNSTIRANSRDKHRNHTYRHRSPNTSYSPIDKRAPSPDWTELERQKTRALNLRLNGSRSLHKVKRKQLHSTSYAPIPATLCKEPAIRSFAILDTPAACGFTANGMKHDLEDIAEEGLAEENAQADSPFDTNKESISEPYNQETDSDFMKAPPRGWNLRVRARSIDPGQELQYHPLPDRNIGLASNHWSSEETLATTIADTEETELLLTKVPFLGKGKQRAQESSGGYEYHLLRHTNTPPIRESWSTNGALVIGTDEENQALLTQDYSPASPRINPIDYQSLHSDQHAVAGSSREFGALENNRIWRRGELCSTNSIPELVLDSVNSQHSVPRTSHPNSPCRSFEEHQEIKHGLLFNSYPKIPTERLCHHPISSSEFGASSGFTRASSIRNDKYEDIAWIEDKTFSKDSPILHGLRANTVRIDTDVSEALNPQPEASNQRRGNDSGYSSVTPEQTRPTRPNRLIVPVTRTVTAGTSEDSTDVTRGRTTTRGRTHVHNTRPTRSQPRRYTGRVTFAPLPDTRRERATSEGHIYHTDFSREQKQLSRNKERSPSPSHQFNHKDYVYDKDEEPKIELPPVRKEPLKGDSPPPVDLNAPVRAISNEPHPYVHQRVERAQRSSDPMDLNNFLPGLQLGNGGGNGKGEKGGKGKYTSMRAMVSSFSDIGRLFKRSQRSKDSCSSQGSGGFSTEKESGIHEKEDSVVTENLTRDWHGPLAIRTKASVEIPAGEDFEDEAEAKNSLDSAVRCSELPGTSSLISGLGEREMEDKVTDSPPLSLSSTLHDYFEEELERLRGAPQPMMYVRALYANKGGHSRLSFRKGDFIRVIKRWESGWWVGERDGVRGWFPVDCCEVIEKPDVPDAKQKTGEKTFGHKPTFVIKKVEVPLSHSSPLASPISPETEDPFDWQEKTEHQRLRVGSKTYVFDEQHEIIEIHSPRKDKSHRNEKHVCSEVVNFSHVTTSPEKEVLPFTRAKRLKAHLDRTRDSRLGRGSSSLEDPNRKCSRCGKVSCVCGHGDLDHDGPKHDDYEDSDQRRCGSYRTLFTERNTGFHMLIPLCDTHGSDTQSDECEAFDEYDEAGEGDVDDFNEKDLVAFPPFTGLSSMSETGRERLDLIACIGSFNADEYERQEKGDPDVPEALEELKVSDLASTVCLDSGENQDNARLLLTLQEIVEESEIADWLEQLATLEDGLSPQVSRSPQIDQNRESDALKEAMAQTIQHINHLVHIKRSAPIEDDEENPVGQRWQDRWRDAFLESLTHLRRLIERDDDRRVNLLMDRQLKEQDLEMAEVDRRIAELKREIREQERRDRIDREAREWGCEWFDVDLDGIGDIERVQFMVGHMVAARTSWGMLSEREMSGC